MRLTLILVACLLSVPAWARDPAPLPNGRDLAAFLTPAPYGVSVNSVRMQRLRTYEAVTVAATAVSIAVATLDDMRTCQGIVETAEIRMRDDGTAPTSTTGTPMGVGASIEWAHVEDARFSQFIRTGSVNGILHVRCWQ